VTALSSAAFAAAALASSAALARRISVSKAALTEAADSEEPPLAAFRVSSAFLLI